MKQGTGGLVRHLQHKHADESEDLAAITASYPSPATLPRLSNLSAPCEDGDEEMIVQPMRKKARVLPSQVSVEVLEAKIKREEHNLKMWRDAKDELKQLKIDLASAETEEEQSEIKDDIEGFKQRKAAFAKLLGFDVVRSKVV